MVKICLLMQSYTVERCLTQRIRPYWATMLLLSSYYLVDIKQLLKWFLRQGRLAFWALHHRGVGTNKYAGFITACVLSSKQSQSFTRHTQSWPLPHVLSTAVVDWLTLLFYAFWIVYTTANYSILPLPILSSVTACPTGIPNVQVSQLNF